MLTLRKSKVNFMKKISKIEIKNFRSIKTQVIENLSDLNVFSGSNDVGKSNVLRALDMFFNKKHVNFFEEFNLEKKSEIKRSRQKQIISVKIYFINNIYKNLPPKFFVKRTWDKSGDMINQYDDTETWRKSQSNITQTQVKTALSLYLNKFCFKYIPAIKDNVCFNTLLVEMYNAIVNNRVGTEQEFEATLSDFNDKLANLSDELSQYFLSVANIKTAVALPTSAIDLAKRLEVSTFLDSSSQNIVPLFNRGDGVRMHYIPAILNFISKQEKNKWHIWAIDEPETSCEYSKSFLLANDFKNTYSKDNQIFLSSHSFHFISLTGNNVSRYRVYRNKNNSEIKFVNADLFSTEDDSLKSDLGVFTLLEGLQKVYDRYQEEMNLLSKHKKIIANTEKPLLLFEGASDRVLFQKAFSNLYPHEASDYTYSEPADEINGGVIGEGANSLAGFVYSHIPKIVEATNNKPIIAVFDNDYEGCTQFKKIAKNFSNIYEGVDINGHQVLKHKRFNVYVIKLVAPEFRAKWVNDETKYCYLSVELLLHDDLIPEDSRDIIPDTTPQKYTFKGNNKINFAEKVPADADFSGFKKTIDLIRSIKDSTIIDSL